jgi:hypothetical protein
MMVIDLIMGGFHQKGTRTPVLRVSFVDQAGTTRELEFDHAIRLGRTDDCDVCIKQEYVSRAHAEVRLENGGWTLNDLNSSNGIFVGGQRVTSCAVRDSTSVHLGIKGPVVVLQPEYRVIPQPQPEPAVAPPVQKMTPQNDDVKVEEYMKRYFGERPEGAPVGEHTMYVRQAYSRVQKKERRKYGGVVAALGIVTLVAAGIAWYEHSQADKQRLLAKDLFYSMKSLDVDIASFEKLVIDSGSVEGREKIQKNQARRRQMEANYDRFLTALRVYDPKMTREDRLILRVARIFGECELDMPAAFRDEIKNYIQSWKSTGRLAQCVRNARENGYAPFISKEFLAMNLPPQFFYLALQESDFNPFNIGPKTRMGIAKGMWQFIPQTAAKYGLRVGPLAELRRPDVADDRHNWQLATKAAASYIKELYSTDAQASGLLVMACYNWGEDRVLPLIRSMPANPRERNFWRLLTQHRDKIPDETYKYVFSIASAAVIGEDPHLFGFDFDNPLGHLDAQ